MQAILQFIGWFIIVVGTIVAIQVVSHLTIDVPYGFDLGTHAEPNPYRWQIGFAVILSNCIVGVFFLSLAKIIDLLSQIHASLSQAK